MFGKLKRNYLHAHNMLSSQTRADIEFYKPMLGWKVICMPFYGLMHPSSEKITPLNLNKQKVHTKHIILLCLLSPAQISVRFPQADRTLVQLPIPPQSTDGGGYSVVSLSELY